MEGRRCRFRINFRPLDPLDTCACFFKELHFAYAIKTKSYKLTQFCFTDSKLTDNLENAASPNTVLPTCLYLLL